MRLGSFLIRAFERVCEPWQKPLTADLRELLDCASPLALSASPATEKRQRAAALQDATAISETQAPLTAAIVIAAGMAHHSELTAVEIGLRRVGEVLLGCAMGFATSWLMSRLWPVPHATPKQP